MLEKKFLTLLLSTVINVFFIFPFSNTRQRPRIITFKYVIDLQLLIIDETNTRKQRKILQFLP